MKQPIRKIILASSLTFATLCGLTTTGCVSPYTQGANSIGLKRGSTVSFFLAGGGALGFVKFQVTEVQGNWVKAQLTESDMEAKEVFGTDPIWINMNTTTYVKVNAK